MATDNVFSVSTDDPRLLNVIGRSQRTIQRWSLEGVIESALVGNQILVHVGYLDPNSVQMRRLSVTA